MGDHDAPVSWLDQWKAQEPLRLWLWSIACAVLVLAGVAGWLTAQVGVAITGVLAAILMVGGTAGARRETFAPATVGELLDNQHAESYARGYQSALRTVEEAAAQRPELQPATEALEAQWPGTMPHQSLRPCPFMDEDGHRCTLPEHPRKIPHRLELGEATE